MPPICPAPVTELLASVRLPPGFNPAVLALAYEGLCAFEFGCVAEVFGLARPELGPQWYRFETGAMRAGRVRAQFGLSLLAGSGLARLPQVGTIIIPGWTHIDAPVPRSLVRALRDAHARGARLMSICSGAVVLAATGLLDGQHMTTHWRYAQALQARFPKVQVDPDVLYVDCGQVLSSAGSAAGIDLCLHLVRRDFGPAVANHVARRLVVPPHREGGQAQYIEKPVPVRSGDPLARLLDVLREQLALAHDVPAMARMANMSERSLMRRFRSSTGMTPADWLIQARVDRARELLEGTSMSIEQIADATGLGSAITLRHHFRRKLGASPTSYRRRFNRA